MSEILIPNAVYKSQIDNENNPHGSCNVTSMAMGLCWGGCPGAIDGRQIEDWIYEYLLNKGYSRHAPYDLARGTNEWRERNFCDNSTFATLRTDATWQQIEKHVAEGKPCVVHGWFTKSGHIVAIVGKYNGGWIVNDPYGEWFPDGYDTYKSGEQVRYSHQLMDGTCGPDGTIWCHFFDKSHPDPFPKIEDRYRGTEGDIILQKIYHEKLEVSYSEINNYSVLVRQIQVRLTAIGFNPGKTDSIWGAKTESAYTSFCNKFQIDSAFPIDAKISELLIEAK